MNDMRIDQAGDPCRHPPSRRIPPARVARPAARRPTRASAVGRTGGALAVVLGAVLAFAAPAPVGAADVELDGIAAVVNDGVVLASDVRAETAFLRAQADSNRQPLPDDEILRERVLERLIDQEIRGQRAARLGVVVDATSVNRAIERVARSNNMDALQFRRTLQGQGFDYERFRRNIEQELLLQRLVQRDVESRVRVSAREIDDYVDALRNDAAGQRRHRLRHVLVAVPASAPSDEIAAGRARADDIVTRLRAGEEFAAVAAAESDGARALQGGDLGWRTRQEVPAFLRGALDRLALGEISEPLRSADGLHVIRVDEREDADANRREETRARHIFLASDAPDTEARLVELRRRILAGESFAELARRVSDDPNSAPEGGELPWFAAGELPPEMERVAASLAIGELGVPFRTQFGWHLLEVLERRTSDVGDDALRRRAENALRERRIEQETERWVRQLRDESFIEKRA